MALEVTVTLLYSLTVPALPRLGSGESLEEGTVAAVGDWWG